MSTAFDMSPQNLGGFPKFRESGANGAPAIELGAGSYFSSPVLGSVNMDGIRMFLVYSRAPADTGGLFCLGSGACGPTYRFLIDYSTVGIAGLFADQMDSTNASTTPNIPDPFDWTLVEVAGAFDSPPSVVTMVVNGATETGTHVSTNGSFSTNFLLFGKASSPMTGYLAEAVVYDGSVVPTAADVIAIRNHLLRKYNLP